jgi:DNA-binding LacI/PurR family transcriptional regulator
MIIRSADVSAFAPSTGSFRWVTSHGRPTLDTVAQVAGVSRMTVSNAYNRPDQLSEVTRERILRIAAELGYPGPDPAGRSLRRRRSGTVGMLLTERLPYAFADPGMVSFLHGVAAELGDAGFALLLLPTEGNQDHALVRNAIVDAFIVASLARDDPAVADVVARRLPIVTWGNLRLPGVPQIGIDNARAAGSAARHLLELGHRRFAVVSFGIDKSKQSRALAAAEHDTHDLVEAVDVPGTYLAMRLRVAGFLRALAEAGIGAAEVTVVDAGANNRAAGEAVATELLAEGIDRPTAVFAVTDVLALGVLQAAKARWIDVPADLSVVGFDGIEEAARSSPPLTTVSQGLFEQGRSAARVVLGEVAEVPVKAGRVVSEVVVRASTAAPPSTPRIVTDRRRPTS